MSLRNKTLIAVLAVYLMLFIIVYTASASIIGQSFRDLEAQGARQDMKRIGNALNDELEALSRTNGDYAAWDDSYAFVSGALPEYVTTNLGDDTFIVNRFSLMMFVDPQRRVVFAKAFNLKSEEVVPVPPTLAALDAPSDMLTNLPALESVVSGVLMLPEGPMMITSRPIITSAFTGPANGTLIIGRMLDDSVITRLAESTRVQLSLHRLDRETLSPFLIGLRAQLTPDQPVAVGIISDSQLVTVGLRSDIAGRPALLFQITAGRDVYNSGQAAIRYFGLALLATGFIITILGALLLDYFVLRRLTRIGIGVGAVGASGDISGRLAVDGDDEIARLARDINTMLTDIEASQIQLRASEMRFQQLVSVAPEPIIVHDRFVIRYCNPAGAALLGEKTGEACVGMRLTEFTSRPSDLVHMDGQDTTPQWCEARFSRRREGVIDAEYLAVPFLFEQTEMTLLIVRDITLRKQTELALQSAKNQADEANQAKTRFLATMSHELRTPLTAILGYNELLDLEAQINFPQLLPDLDKIRQSGNHLLALINDVLDLSKIEAGQMRIYPQRFDMVSMLHEVAATVAPLAVKNKNVIEMQLSEDLTWMYTDQTKMRQIVLNLVNNACKFTHGGRVMITADLIDGKLRLQIADTGIGISVEHMSRLFHDFQQADSSSTRQYGGTGLGLSLSRRLCQLLGGDISVESALGVGSTFVITIPITHDLADHDEALTTMTNAA